MKNWIATQIPFNKKWLFLGLFTISMVNIGFDENILAAFQCGQYYFDYLVYLGLGLLLYKLTQKLPGTYHSLPAILLLTVGSTYFFELFYTWVTNCDFSTILFFTSKSPFIACITLLIGPPKKHPLSVVNPTSITVRTVNNGQKKISNQQIFYAMVQHATVRIFMADGTQLIVNETLKNIEEQLSNEDDYYKLNRQILVKKDAIEQITPVPAKGIKVELFDGTTTMVNKNNTKDFKQWFNA